MLFCLHFRDICIIGACPDLAISAFFADCIAGASMWSFDRLRDKEKIIQIDLLWQGPFAWPGFEQINTIKPLPDIAGVYALTFEYSDGYLLYSAGITKSTKRRICAHTREYRNGKYTVLDPVCAGKGERSEVWHGWQYARQHHDEFVNRKTEIQAAAERQLQAYRIFVAEVPDTRIRERIEAGIMENLYSSKEYWSELACRGMFLKGRYNCEMPIVVHNISSGKIYGLHVPLEV